MRVLAGHSLACNAGILLLERPTTAASLGLSHFSLHPWTRTCPCLVALAWLPVKATLPWARPFCKVLVIPLFEGLSWTSAAFGSILICLRVTGYPLRCRLAGGPVKGPPCNGADVTFHKKGSPKSRAVCPRKGLVEGSCLARWNRSGGGKGRCSHMIQNAEPAWGRGKVILLKEGRAL